MKELYLQAKDDMLSTILNTPVSQSAIYKGVKIEVTDESVRVMNTKLNGDYYRDVTPEQMEVFTSGGWRLGVYNVCVDNYNRTLNRIARLIQDELGRRNNIKHYNALKEFRYSIMIKYSDVIKLRDNELNKQNGKLETSI
jgi:hypothetical protein